jgi:hypothetical protein
MFSGPGELGGALDGGRDGAAGGLDLKDGVGGTPPFS